jgi:hypothetical protein
MTRLRIPPPGAQRVAAAWSHHQARHRRQLHVRSGATSQGADCCRASRPVGTRAMLVGHGLVLLILLLASLWLGMAPAQAAARSGYVDPSGHLVTRPIADVRVPDGASARAATPAGSEHFARLGATPGPKRER